MWVGPELIEYAAQDRTLMETGMTSQGPEAERARKGFVSFVFAAGIASIMLRDKIQAWSLRTSADA